MRKVTVAAIQMACSPDAAENRRTAEAMVRQAAGNGAQIILLPEQFETPYFCQERRYASYELATTPAENPAIAQLRKVAAELQVVLPVSFYEKAGTALYNSIAIIDADGTMLGIYRKTHIPDDHFYQEKFYFTPGDLGYKAFDTNFGRIGVLICWDQWYPEAARLTAMQGAEIIFYPTAIGWLPEEKPLLEPIRVRDSTEKIVDDPEEEKPEAAESPEPKAPRSRNRRRKPRPQVQQDAAPEQAKPAPQEAAAKTEATGDRPRRRPNHRRRKPRPAGDGQ